MKKRLIALLLCACMVLGMAPNGVVFSVSGETAQELTVDENGQGLCPVCNETVKWTAFAGNSAGTQALGSKNDGGHYHVYLSGDVNARSITNAFLNLQKNTTMCLHLNGHDLVMGGYMFVAASTLNIMGSGNVIFTATNTSNTYDQGALYANGSGIFNLYGGTYSVAEDALAEGKPTLCLAIAGSQANVKNATFKGQALIKNGTLTLEEATNFEDIQVSASGKLFVKSNWTGEAQAAFAAAMNGNVVPAANGVCDGAFTGTLKMAYGVTLQGSDAGTLTATGINAGLALDANSQALCPVCNKTVTWTAFSGNAAGTLRMGQFDDGGHYHYYLSGDVDARKIANYFLHVFKSSQMCLHLNGHDLTHGGYVYVSASVLNIIGSGNMTFTATKTSSGYDQGGLYVGSSGTVNLYGGTYSVAEVAETSDKPAVFLKNGTLHAQNGAVYGRVYAEMGSVILENAAQLENIQVETAAKLVVKSSWSGDACVSFAAGLTDYKVPTANATAEQGFTGELTMTDDSKLRLNADGVLVATGVNSALLLDENSQGECPVCEETVTWTEVKDGANIGWKPDKGHLHYYLASDVTSKAGSQFTELELGTKVCLHLNGNDLTLSGQCRLWKNSTLNIMGTGNVDFAATAGVREDWMEAGILSLGGTANLYSGTYTVSGAALEEGKPAVLVRNTDTGRVNLIGATVNGPSRVDLGQLVLSKRGNAADIQVNGNGKLTVSENWTGTAQVGFSAMLEDDQVPAKNGAAEGEFKGTLTMADGSQLFATEQGTLKRKITLSLDANSQALCPVCNETVTWTVFNGNAAGTAKLGTISDGAHHHRYLSADVDARYISSSFVMLTGSTQMCLHLNGHQLRYGSYMAVAAGTTLNIMGTGDVIFTGTHANHEYNIGGFYVTGGNLNLYGGTYSLGETALTEKIPMIYYRNDRNTSTTTVKNATVKGVTNVLNGSLILEEAAQLENAQIASAAKLTATEGWYGMAEVSFAAGLTDGAVPEANGISTGDFVGGLRLSDGTLLKGENGRLVEKTDMDLRLTEDGIGYCPVCQKTAKWLAINDGDVIGVLPAATDSHHHYYFAQDNMTTKAGKYFLQSYAGNTVCLHLNGKTVAVSGAMQVRGGTLNVLGDGNVDFLGNTGTANADLALFNLSIWGEKALNIYGGTYTSSTGKQMMDGSGGNYTVNMVAKLYGNTKLDGLVTLTQSQLHLNDSATVKRIEGSNTASIRVAENWRGSATVEYFTQMTGDYISEYGGRSEGDFIGGLMLADGRRLVGENGKLRIVEAGQLVLNDQQEGYCEACNQVVTWTAFAGNSAGTLGLSTINNGAHHHIYLSTDVNAKNVPNMFLNLLSSSKLCLHLNGHALAYGGYIMVGGGTTMNIMGSGSTTFTDTNEKAGHYDIAGMYANGGNATINLYGGTHGVSGRALELGKPTIHIREGNTGKVTVKNATIEGTINALGGTLTLEQAAQVEDIQIGSKGKLAVKDSWTGSAAVELDAAITGNQIPAANGSSTGAFTGKLTLADGRAVTGGDNKLVIGGEAVDTNLSYKITETGVELVSYTGEGNYLLPDRIAGKPVTTIAAGAFNGFTGTLYIGKSNAVGLAYARENELTFVEASVFTREDGTQQLLENAENLTFEQDTVLDLNGYSINTLTATNGTVSVMDSQTDDFTVKDGVYGKIANIVGTVKAAENYLQVSEEAGISFHRVDLDIYAMSLRTTNAGVYYKSNFAGDEVVAQQVESFGVALSVVEEPTAANLNKHCGYSSFTEFAPGAAGNAGSATSTLLYGIMKTSNTEKINIRNSQKPVYGRAYIKTADGYLFGQTVMRTLQEQVKLADGFFEQLSEAQKENAQTMFETYQPIMEQWGLTGFGNYKDRLWFQQPAPDTGSGFEEYSVPLGNGYTGISVFGGTETETLSVSDKTMFNPAITGQNDAPAASDTTMKYGQGGLTNMCKVHIDFGHAFDQVSNYQRDLVMKTAQAHVRYDYDGVTYNRTYFSSYPDNVTVMKLDASQSGKLSFTLRPEATYVRDYAVLPGDGAGKTGTVTASGNTAIVAGTLSAYNVNYEAQLRVIPVGGTMVANSDGTITVENADSAVILMSAGTNYVLKPETLTAPNKQKLDPNSYPHDAVTAVLDAAAAKSYAQLLDAHLADYQELYCRVEMDLGGEPSTVLPTDKMMQAYRAGSFDPYLEELLFQYGRYLLIACSRSGTLPANLQGIWQYYPAAAWDGKYVYNINLQMNYWSCFATNLAELFEPNIEFFDAIWSTLQSNADNYLTGVKSPYKEESGTGANGIAIGATGSPYITPKVSTSVNTHTGPGSTGYTSDLFWQYYQFTNDEEALKRVYPYLEGAATFLSKTLEDYDGKWLVSHSASPENNMYFENPFVTVGTMFDQMMTRESFVQALEAARLLGYTASDSPILTDLEAKLSKLDPVNVGKDGHVKEYREEEYYGDFGLYEHHGMGQLVGVYPGTTITNQTDAWQDAAAVTAIERGINFTGHQASFKQLVWARLGDAQNSYLTAQEHIVKYIRDNLWNTHTPFQIDGNFGYTAGVAEMLLQSHEGYIKVLPALPEQWNTGSYKGLTARGGFEVDVAWQDGAATEIAITSNAGEPCSLNHFRVSTATVVDSKGNAVTFTVDSADQITFATVKGETYTITELQAKPAVEAPADLTVTEDYHLTWQASSDAVSYKVYRAVNDQAAYELIADNVTATAYTYAPTDLQIGDQVILRVTAVNADGVESDGSRAITWVEAQSE